MVEIGETEISVSIVMPVYNVEKYLHECMDSVVNQTLKKLQIICVDDASTDSSVDILERYAEKDERIRVLRGCHQGAAAARNMGMKYALGEYICFLDSDDIFELDMIEELYTSAKKHDAEIAICECDTKLKVENRDFLGDIMKKYMGKYSESTFCMDDLPAYGFSMWRKAPWSRLYKREFLLRNKLQFQQIESANDVYLATMAMIYADRMIHTSSYKALVHYRTNREGQISSSRNVMNAYRAWEKIYTEMQKCNVDKKLFRQYQVGAFDSLIGELSEKSESCEQKKEFYEFFTKEGMERIGLNNEIEEKGLESYREVQKCFREKPFQSQWYQQYNLCSVQLEEKGVKEIKELCQRKRVGFWGAGKRGRAVLYLFKREKVKLSELIDSDPKKSGTIVAGYKVMPELKKDLEIIVIATKVAYNSIFADIRENSETDVKILPLFMWAESELELKDCIVNVDLM